MNTPWTKSARRIASALSVCFALASSTIAFAAEPTPAAKSEIAALLTRLSTSDCEFNRNGKWYGADAARTHLEKKYEYLVRKKLIGSAEDFIVGAATESSVSGQPYQVRCNGKTTASAPWLTDQLQRIRQPRGQ